ncbi:MAG: threonine aldolase family protein [Terriglobales bacterium]
MRGRFSPKGMTQVQEMEGRGVRAAVDLRSDTVTRPTQEMRRAMMAAEVGDDVYGEDPTVNRLEAQAIALFEREAAVFVPSGTMANQIAIHLHTRPGQEIICEAKSHAYNVEMAMAAAFSGCIFRPVTSASGRMPWSLVQPALRLDDPQHHAQTGLVIVENTHNFAGGVVTPPEMMRHLCAELRNRGVATHLDGARIFNAALALGATVAELSSAFDTVMFCLSKGLGAPVGSILLGSGERMARARAIRKMLGGGMRQAGVLASAGLVALEKGPPQLAADHHHAQILAEGLPTITGVRLDPPEVATNIVIFDVSHTEFSADHVVAGLAERNILASALDATHIRFVTHCDVDEAQCQEALFALRAVIERE